MKQIGYGHAMIGVAQADGRVFAARTTAAPRLSDVLDACYGDALAATMLVSLGDTSSIGDTPRDCAPARDGDPDPDLVETTRFEAMGGASCDFHLFENGRWSHWSTRRAAATLSIDTR